jgi:adenosylhomocysteine nucleosidase
MKAVGLIAAMPQEIAPFLRRVGKYERFRLASFYAYRFRLFELDCVLVRCGVGFERAIAASRALIEATRPELLVSFGVAGAVRPGLRVGDVIVAAAEGTCLLDDPAVAVAEDPFRSLAHMSPQAQQAVSAALLPRRAHFYTGTILTTRGSQVVPSLPAQVVYPVLDMETAGIAQVAAEYGLPLLGLRAISDSVDQPLPFNLDEMLDEQQNLHIGRIVGTIIRHPHMLAQSLRLSQNVNRASQNLAAALFEALKHTDMLD